MMPQIVMPQRCINPTWTTIQELDNETSVMVFDFMHIAGVFFAAHVNTRLERVPTDNGSCYRGTDFASCTTRASEILD